MIRLACLEDAEQLAALNEAFNGPGDVSIEQIRASLSDNHQELVFVEEEAGHLTGFLCLQLKKSFCYREYTAEITELYVRPAFRRRGIARRLMAFAENYCLARFPVSRFELLTGDDNLPAQAAYRSLGYAEDGELHLAKETGKE